jgi:glycyl-tRNA synthetase
VATGGLPAFYVYHLAHSFRFYRDVLGYPGDSLRLFEKSYQERAFYNKIQFDIELRLESLGGYKELGAVHYRGDYDLSRHSEGSGQDLSVMVAGRRLVPHVLELTFGVDRNLWALADTGLRHEGDRTVWKLPGFLAPAPVGVFPLLKREHSDYARQVVDRLRDGGIRATYDSAGSIGKRYARMDEAGTPYCLTIDGETVDAGHVNHGTVTMRERDSKAQERVRVDALVDRLRPLLSPPRATAGVHRPNDDAPAVS